MSDYIKHKEYKLPNGRTVTAEFNELGCAMVTIQAMDALFDILNSTDVVEVVRCKDCAHYNAYKDNYMCGLNVLAYVHEDDFCSRGERAEE